MLESSLVEEEDTSRATFDIPTNTPPLEGLTYNRAYSSRSTGTTDIANTKGSNRDGPLVIRRRRRTRPYTHGSKSLSLPLPLTPGSSVYLVEVRSTAVLYRYKRLGRQKGIRRNSRTLETNDTSTSLNTSSRGSSER